MFCFDNFVLFADFTDTGAMWRSVYETETFQEDLKSLLEDLNPLYKLLHAYVRKQLKETYGAENFPTTGHIPAHLLGKGLYLLVIPSCVCRWLKKNKVKKVVSHFKLNLC